MKPAQTPPTTSDLTQPCAAPMSATTWVLLRGLTREAAHWGDFPRTLRQALQARQPGVQLLTPDLPGNGQRHREPSPVTVQGMVAACRADLQRQGVQGPVVLLAMSLGAMVAAEWAHTAPGEVAGCVLINTSMQPFSPFHHRLRPVNYPSLLRLALGRMAPDAAERCILRLTSNHVGPLSGVITDWAQAREQRPVQPGNALRQLLAAARYRAPRTPPPVPLLLLRSARDRLVHPRCSIALAEAWQRPLITHPTAGHDLPLDDPRWVMQQVLAWWASNGSGTPEQPG